MELSFTSPVAAQAATPPVLFSGRGSPEPTGLLQFSSWSRPQQNGGLGALHSLGELDFPGPFFCYGEELVLTC